MNFNDNIRKQLARKESGRKEFMELIEIHQQSWVNGETYKGKPSLQQILDSPVVAFWYPSKKTMYMTITLHRDLTDINEYLKALVLNLEERLPVLRLGAVFVNKIPRKVKAINIVWE